MHRFIPYFYLFIFSAVGVAAQDNVEQLDLTLKNQKYQPLPTEVRDVFVDQDERLWYLLSSAYRQEAPGKAECEAEIKAQFGKKQPTLKLVKPVLFGPGKMVWFSPVRNHPNPRLTVFGYDGTTFIDYKETQFDDIASSIEVYVTGTPESNLQTPTAQFFITNMGMLVYHKNTFSHRYLSSGSARDLSYDPKNKQVLMIKGSSTGLDSVRLWKDGKWIKLDLPKPEEKARHAFFHQGRVQFLRENTPIVLGKYTCKSPKFLCYHENDIYLTAEEILADNTPQGPGIIIVKTDGSYAALLLKDTPTYGRVIRDGKMWCKINGTTCVLDLKAGKIVDRHKIPGYVWAVSGNRVYVGGFPLLVYQPDAPETRQALPVLHNVKSSWRGAFSEDGILYIRLPKLNEGEYKGEYGYIYYDGKTWGELPNLRFDCPGDFMMGRNHTFIDISYQRKGGGEWRLLKDGKVIDTSAQNSFLELIKKNKGIVSENMSDVRLGGLRIVTSGPNGIWADYRTLKALSGNTWIDIDAELKKKGLERYHVTRLVKGYVYLTALSRGPKSRPEKHTGFVASIDNGKLKLQPAPFGHAPSNTDGYLNVRDPKALWLNAVDSAESGNAYSGKPAAIRLSPKGVLQTIKHKGHAAAYDKIGNVWIGVRSPYSSVDKGIYHIWRDGKIVSSIRIPGGTHRSTFFSDRSGSVYVWTQFGLHHYVASPKDPTTYSLRKTYYVPSVEGKVTFSQRGFMAIGANGATLVIALPKN